jgi:hypothetical protein
VRCERNALPPTFAMAPYEFGYPPLHDVDPLNRHQLQPPPTRGYGRSELSRGKPFHPTASFAPALNPGPLRSSFETMIACFAPIVGERALRPDRLESSVNLTPVGYSLAGVAAVPLAKDVGSASGSRMSDARDEHGPRSIGLGYDNTHEGGHLKVPDVVVGRPFPQRGRRRRRVGGDHRADERR